ncbi:MAG: RNA polymerase sigma factor [Oscillospiraceae bacterium]|nr:RNA polymerase sigma factor [Oscillospiraceae bacterium]
MNDAEIIALFYKRDERAVIETAAQYGAVSMRVAMRILNNRQDAEECVNDAYLRLWNTVPPENPAHFQGYLLTLVRRTALDRVDFTNRKKRGGGRVAQALDELDNDLLSEDNVERSAEQAAVSEAIARFLSALQNDQRNILMKRYWFLENASEIAKDLHLSESNVRVTLMRLRQRLKAFLEKEELL